MVVRKKSNTRTKTTSNAGVRTRPKTNIDVSLPEKENVPPSKLEEYSIALYGEKGVGKSSLSSEIDKDSNIHFMFEHKRRNLRIKSVPQKGEPPLDWPRFKAYRDHILSLPQKKRPNRITVDSFDICCTACDRYHAERLGQEDGTIMGINDYGKVWGALKSDFEEVFFSFLFSDIKLTLISHVRLRPMIMKSVPREDQKDLPDVVQPTCSGWGWEFMKEFCDFAWYFGYTGRERTLLIRGNEYIWASSPVDDHFLQPDTSRFNPGDPLEILPMGASPKEAHTNLQTAWNNQLEGYFNE